MAVIGLLGTLLYPGPFTSDMLEMAPLLAFNLAMYCGPMVAIVGAIGWALRQEGYGTVWVCVTIGFTMGTCLAGSLIPFEPLGQFILGTIIGGLPGAIIGWSLGALIRCVRGP